MKFVYKDLDIFKKNLLKIRPNSTKYNYQILQLALNIIFTFTNRNTCT